MRAELMAARTEAAAEAIGRRPLECAHDLTAGAHLARARGDADAAERAAAAASAWDALSRPYQAAQMRLREAEAHAAAGDREAAGAAAARGLSGAEELGAAWLASEVAGFVARARLPVGATANGAGSDGTSAPPPARDDGDPFGLTPRERQVLAALAAGRTNREIAAELFMAEKTASVHVSRILAKLGVRSRTEAAAVAHRLALTDPA
jgi:DNA-binding NarL/FixJ family response regulator